MNKLIRSYRNGFADWLQQRADQLRDEELARQGRLVFGLEDEQFARMRRTIDWKFTELGLAWANLFDGLAHGIRASE